MQKGINRLADKLKGLNLKCHSKTPIEHDPTREPVNRQAAMMLAKSEWICKPIPQNTPEYNTSSLLKAITRLEGELLASRSECSRLNDIVALKKKELKDAIMEIEELESLKRINTELSAENRRLKTTIKINQKKITETTEELSYIKELL